MSLASLIQSPLSSKRRSAVKVAGQSPNASSQVEQRFFRTRALDDLPIKLTHERIYILPTRRGIVFIIGLLVMLVTSMNYALGLGYGLCFLLTGLFSASLLATYRNVQSITLTAINATQCSVGESLEFELELHNPNRLDMHFISISDRDGHSSDLPHLASRQSQTIVLRVAATIRGWQALGRLRVRSEYPLGLWFAWGYWHVPSRALVLPASENPAPPPPPPQADQHDEIDKQKKPGQTSSGEIHAIRPYQSGDSLSSIHWKASARGMGLLTREFETDPTSETLELHWNDTATLSDTEQRVSRLAAWCRQCASDSQAFSLQLPGPTNPGDSDDSSGKRPNADNLQGCLKALALFDKNDTDVTGQTGSTGS